MLYLCTEFTLHIIIIYTIYMLHVAQKKKEGGEKNPLFYFMSLEKFP